jgi:hypothetical protein
LGAADISSFVMVCDLVLRRVCGLRDRTGAVEKVQKGWWTYYWELVPEKILPDRGDGVLDCDSQRGPGRASSFLIRVKFVLYQFLFEVFHVAALAPKLPGILCNVFFTSAEGQAALVKVEPLI